ncbi:MAG: hypothetical protein KAW61_05645, partial [candidate division Zixibacteria bacterium]|nr:hypothetical protein [candidate division Zixibacteria bacterium]
AAILTYQNEGFLQTEPDMSKYALNHFDYSLGLPFYYVLQSDSILYWGMNDVRKLACAMKSACFSMHMLAVRNKLFVRGAVSRGHVAINPMVGIYHGKPIVEAVGIEKQMKVPGIIIPLTYLNHDERLQLVQHLPYFVPCTYRFRDGKTDKCLYVNWVYFYVQDTNVVGFDQLGERLRLDGHRPEDVDLLIAFLSDNQDTFPFPA